uniref:Uncharacterized protein n=1 Tax=Trypanosoma vivax (strain Y486) TaxID=1055687 RepID=G0TUI4_TRYVY|nr:hypothetical protein, unlikely [Trypanosoma vivax Y486]
MIWNFVALTQRKKVWCKNKTKQNNKKKSYQYKEKPQLCEVWKSVRCDMYVVALYPSSGTNHVPLPFSLRFHARVNLISNRVRLSPNYSESWCVLNDGTCNVEMVWATSYSAVAVDMIMESMSMSSYSCVTSSE